KDHDLLVATHRRSFRVLDDLTPVHQFNAQSTQTDVILYQPHTALPYIPPRNSTNASPSVITRRPAQSSIIISRLRPKKKSRWKFSMLQAKSSDAFPAKRKKKANNRLNGRTESSGSRRFQPTRG